MGPNFATESLSEPKSLAAFFTALLMSFCPLIMTLACVAICFSPYGLIFDPPQPNRLNLYYFLQYFAYLRRGKDNKQRTEESRPLSKQAHCLPRQRECESSHRHKALWKIKLNEADDQSS